MEEDDIKAYFQKYDENGNLQLNRKEFAKLEESLTKLKNKVWCNSEFELLKFTGSWYSIAEISKCPFCSSWWCSCTSARYICRKWKLRLAPKSCCQNGVCICWFDSQGRWNHCQIRSTRPAPETGFIESPRHFIKNHSGSNSSHGKRIKNKVKWKHISTENTSQCLYLHKSVFIRSHCFVQRRFIFKPDHYLIYLFIPCCFNSSSVPSVRINFK